MLSRSLKGTGTSALHLADLRHKPLQILAPFQKPGAFVAGAIVQCGPSGMSASLRLRAMTQGCLGGILSANFSLLGTFKGLGGMPPPVGTPRKRLPTALCIFKSRSPDKPGPSKECFSRHLPVLASFPSLRKQAAHNPPPPPPHPLSQSPGRQDGPE